MNSNYTVPIAIIIGGLVVALAVYFAVTQNPPRGSAVTAGNPALVRPVDKNDHIFGNPAAKVMLVEYSDFDCTFCKNFDTTLHEIVANEGASGNVAWVYRHFPLIEIHPDTMNLARAAECAASAGGADAFWKFANLLFTNQPADVNKLGEYAASAGVPGDAFASCYANASDTFDAKIKADRENALSMGAKGTPFSVIVVAGQAPVVMDGAYPYDAVKALIDTALGE